MQRSLPQLLLLHLAGITAAVCQLQANAGWVSAAHIYNPLQPQSAVVQRKLLQSSYVSTTCNADGRPDAALILDHASKVLGSADLQLTAARFKGSCSSFGIAALPSTNSLAQQFSTAVVLSTGDISSLALESNDITAPLSANLNQPGEASISSNTYDAAVLELDILVSPSSSNSRQQLILSYVLASEEYGSGNANPDPVVIAIRPNTSNQTSRNGTTSSSSLSSSSSSSSSISSIQQYTDVAVLPGGSHLPPPGVVADSVPVGLYYNLNGQFSTAWNGFTQVILSQGYTVSPGGSYTLRIAVADANNGLLDSVLLLPVGGLKLHAAPVAAAGGPYAVAPNAQVSLSASKSSSSNGAIQSYLWRITPYGSTTPVITATSPVITVPAPPAGQYNVTLDVWDVIGGHDTQTTTLSVDESNVLDWWSDTPVFATTTSSVLYPRPTAVIVVNGTTADTVYVKARSDSPVALLIDGSRSGDQRGSQLAYSWVIAQTEPDVQQLDVMLPYAQPSKFVYSFDIGVYLISLDVTGPGGIGSAQTLVTVAANTPPVAAAGGPYSTTVGSPVVISAAQSSDPDGDPLTYSWSLFNSTGTQVGSYTGQVLSMKLSRAGTYSLRLTVRDDRGGASSAVTQVTSIDAPPPAPPAAAALPPPPAAAATRPVQLPPPSNLPTASAWPAAVAPTAAATPPAAVSFTPAVVAAVPAAPPPSNTRLAAPSVTGSSSSRMAAVQPPAAAAGALIESTYSTQSAPELSSSRIGTSSIGLRPSSSSMGVGNLQTSGSTTMTTMTPTPEAAMCLYVEDSEGAVTSLWDSAFDTLDDYSEIDMSMYPAAYWAVCEPSSSSTSRLGGIAGLASSTAAGLPAAAAAAAQNAGPTVSTAVIAGPDAFIQASGAATKVYLDATGSTAAAGRSIIAFDWTIKRKSDSAIITQVNGLTVPVWLSSGVYAVSLQVTDTSGQIATAQKEFSIGSAAATAAVISSPGSFLQNAEAGPVEVQLDGRGSVAGPGLEIQKYSWLVLRLPDLAALTAAEGPTAVAKLPVGSYRVYLAVSDSAGLNATATKDFVVGNRAQSGATAVITWPAELVQSSPTGGGLTTVALDATGSAAAAGSSSSGGGSITQYVWAVVDLATKTAAGNATGRRAAVDLPPGSYQAGLLIMDSAGNTATARKNFIVGSDTQPLVINQPPVIRSDLAFNGTTGHQIKISGISDPDGDQIRLHWMLLEQITGNTTSGTGAVVPLSGLAAGQYLLLITATDAQGAETSSTASVTVLPAPGSTVSSTSSTSGQRLAKPAAAVQSSVSIKQLPTITLPKGAVMELDAASLNLVPVGSNMESFMWEMINRNTGEQVATVYGRIGRFELSTVGMFDIKLTAFDSSDKSFNSTGNVRVVAPAVEEGSAAAAAARIRGKFKCGPFVAKQYSIATLSCQPLDAADTQLSTSWKLIGPGLVKISNDLNPKFTGLDPGHYNVEVAVAADDTSPGNGNSCCSSNTVYFASTMLTVEEVTNLVLKLPGTLCAGQAVSLHSPPFALPNSIEPEYEWKVTWVGSEKVLGFTEVLQGSGNSFGFTLKPGMHSVDMTATMPSGATVKGVGNFTVLPCITCKNGMVEVPVQSDKCEAGPLLVKQVLEGSVPQGASVSWQSGSNTTVGTRNITVVATAVTNGVNSTCTATVNFVDTTAPTVKLLNPGGNCVTPPNSRWACWKANELVTLWDNCQAVSRLAFMVSCGEGSTEANCTIRPDGRACVRAAEAGQVVQLQVVARDGSGNVSKPAHVRIEVKSLGDAAGAGCAVAALTSPDAL